MVGLNQIQFELIWDPTHDSNRGRYIEKFETSIQASFLHETTKAAQVQFTVGLLAPYLTTYSEDIEFQIGFTAIGLPESADVKMSDVKSVHGSVCIDDWTSVFWCRFHGLVAKTTDIVKVDLSNQFDEANPIGENTFKNEYDLFIQ